MNVLVTGGAGYIGSHTCVELLEAGHTPIVVDNLCNSSEVSLRRVREITGKEVVFIRGDVRDEALLDQVLEQYRPACAIHFAGLKAVGESVEKPLAYYDNNLRSTLSLCRAMARAGIKRIIFSSSATVYSGDNEMPLGEDARTGGAYREALRETLAEGNCVTVRDLALSGAELLAMGYRGADIGAAQRRLLDHVLDHPEDNRPERLRELLK